MLTTEATPTTMLRTIMEAICKHPAALRIHHDEANAHITMQVDGRDQGRAVGKQGRTITAIGALLWYAGMVSTFSRRPITIELLQPTANVGKAAFGMFQAKKDWDREKIGNLVDVILSTCFGFARGAWVTEDTGRAAATIQIDCDKYLHTASQDPSFEEAITTIVHAAGMACGVMLDTKVEWK